MLGVVSWLRRSIVGLSSRGGPGIFPGKCMRDFSCTKWHWRSYFVLLCEYKLTFAPYSFFHLSPNVYNLSNQQRLWVTLHQKPGKLPDFYHGSLNLISFQSLKNLWRVQCYWKFFFLILWFLSVIIISAMLYTHVPSISHQRHITLANGTAIKKPLTSYTKNEINLWHLLSQVTKLLERSNTRLFTLPQKP
jgi:hypothetical protein